jgi:hypothetical protein
MAFASRSEETKSPSGNGPYCFRIHDQSYHFVSPLHPNEANRPGCGLYIFDSAEATTERLETREHMVEVMQQLEDMLRQVNPFADSYKPMHHIK